MLHIESVHVTVPRPWRGLLEHKEKVGCFVTNTDAGFHVAVINGTEVPPALKYQTSVRLL